MARWNLESVCPQPVKHSHSPTAQSTARAPAQTSAPPRSCAAPAASPAGESATPSAGELHLEPVQRKAAAEAVARAEAEVERGLGPAMGSNVSAPPSTHKEKDGRQIEPAHIGRGLQAIRSACGAFHPHHQHSLDMFHWALQAGGGLWVAVEASHKSVGDHIQELADSLKPFLSNPCYTYIQHVPGCKVVVGGMLINKNPIASVSFNSRRFVRRS